MADDPKPPTRERLLELVDEYTERYLNAELTAISEYSASIERDTREAREEVNADRQSVGLPPIQWEA